MLDIDVGFGFGRDVCPTGQLPGASPQQNGSRERSATGAALASGRDRS